MAAKYSEEAPRSPLDLRCDDDHARALHLGPGLDPAREAIAVGSGAFLDVADVEHGLRGQETEAAERLVLLRLDLDEPRRPAVAQQDERADDQIEVELRLGVTALRLLLQRIEPPLQAVEIGEHQLGLDGVDVGDGVDAVGHVGDFAVLETAHHMGDGVGLADHGEELVAEPLAARRPADEAGDMTARLPEPRRRRRCSSIPPTAVACTLMLTSQPMPA